MPTSADDVAELLDLRPLPVEGGRFRRTYADPNSSAIYFLLTPGDFSALHRLGGVEIYHFYAGAPVRMLLLDPVTGAATEPVLGPDLQAGQRPQIVVPAGSWQGSATTDDWSLIGTTMAPPYTDELFEPGDAGALLAGFPDAAERISQLTR